LVVTNQGEFEQKLVEVMRTKKGALQVLELLAKLNREIGSRADEGPVVRIVIGGNIPLDGMKAVTPPALPCRRPLGQFPTRELTDGGPGEYPPDTSPSFRFPATGGIRTQ
jgi:hypothetical protein